MVDVESNWCIKVVGVTRDEYTSHIFLLSTSLLDNNEEKCKYAEQVIKRYVKYLIIVLGYKANAYVISFLL